MLRRALELKGTIERFQRSQTPSTLTERESGYLFREVRIESEDWDGVLQNLVPLRPFEEATMHPNGNGEDKDYVGTLGALWEVFVRMDVMGNHIDAAMAKVEAISGSEDEDDVVNSVNHISRTRCCWERRAGSILAQDDRGYAVLLCGCHSSPSMKLGWFK